MTLTIPVALAAAVILVVTPSHQRITVQPHDSLPPEPPPLTIRHSDIFGRIATRLVGVGSLPQQSETSITEIQAPIRDTTEFRIERGDTLLAVLTRAGVSRAVAYQLLHDYSDVAELRSVKPGQLIRMTRFPSERLRELRYPLGEDGFLRFWRENDLPATKLKLERIGIVPEIRTAYAAGTIESALFIDGQTAGLSDSVIIQLAEIFGWDIDFSHDLRVGDHFSVAYEERYASDRRLDDGAVLAAELIVRGERFRAIGHRDTSGGMAYFTPEGASLRRSFLRSPLKYTRITSGFTHKRFHPILKGWGAHTGIDYGAPSGTPVRATADGRVEFAGSNGGYGQMIVLRHGGSYSTVYAHLSRFASVARKGATISQGEIIGYVGATGLATGPHLHYEFRVDGTHKNPLTFNFPHAEPVPAQLRDGFLEQARYWGSKLDALGGRVLAQR